jgi:hypothetical protein
MEDIVFPALRRTVPLAALLATSLLGTSALAQEGADVDELRERIEALEAKLQESEAEAEAAPPAEEGAEGEDPLAPDGDPPPPADPAVTVEYDSPDAEDGGGVQVELPRSIKLRINGQVRWRGEFRGDGYAQPKTNNNQDFVVQRTRLGFDLDVFEDLLGAKVVIQDSRRWGDKLDGLTGARLATDIPETHLYEAYGVLRNPFDVPVKVKVGRMEVPKLGDQRLMSNLDWHNVGRSWDGIQVTYEPEGWMIMGFAHNVRESAALAVPGDDNDDYWFAGGYISNRMVTDHQIDAFFYWRKLGDNTQFADSSGHSGNRTDYTFGARMRGKAGVVGYGGFIAYQAGEQAHDYIQAWAAAADMSITVPFGEEAKFKFLTEYAFASGDPDPTDNRVETFDPLLPFAHAHHGHQDLIAWRNMHAVKFATMVSPVKWLSFHTDLHFFWLDRQDDAWYGLGFSRADTANVADHGDVGTELDLYVKAKLFDGHLSIWTGFSHFFEGEFVRDTGSKSSDQSWGFLMMSVNF